MEKLKSMAQARDGEVKALWGSAFIFPFAMWLLSRLLIAAAMLLIAPMLPAAPGNVVPKIGWEVFAGWDSGYYQTIATTGYEYANDDKGHNVAFFPLFPLFIRGFMTLGLSSTVAGTIVNTLAFLGALVVLYRWVEARHGLSAARWATAVLAWFPHSLFGTIVYSEGLFLLFSTAALRAFDQQQHVMAAVWGAIATAARPTGIALVPAFLLASWREKRKPIAYATSLAAGGGLFLYSLYCGLNFGDPLAFAHTQQQGWKRSLGVDWLGWWKILVQVTAGTANWKHGSIVDPWPPLLFITICCLGYLLWHFRKRLGFIRTGDGFVFLGILLWLLAGDPLINAVTIFGAGYLLWRFRHQISPVALLYGFCGLGLILVSGSTISVGRLAYGIVSLAIALGLLLARYPRWGYVAMGFFAILLASFAIRFAQHQWVA